MDPDANEYPTADCIKRAVEQCNKIETSLEGCLKVLQQSCVPNLPDDLNDRQTPDQVQPEPKQSFSASDITKSPNLNEAGDAPDASNMQYMLKCADVKLQNVLASQQRIIQQLGDVHEILIEKDKHTEEAYKHLKLRRD